MLTRSKLVPFRIDPSGFPFQGGHGALFAKSLHGVQELLYVYNMNPGQIMTPISSIYLGVMEIH